MTESIRCYLAERDDDGTVSGNLTEVSQLDLPPGDVEIVVKYSSLNYKDALAATGHPGVVKNLPHVPGIDAVGNVLCSSDDRFAVGQAVIVTGYELGAGQWGGWSERIRVPAEWVVPLPNGLDMRTAMAYGTAGFTAAQSVRELIRNDVLPDGGAVVVTGATGGVGSLAVAILAKLGYRVTASTGKPDASEWLRSLGATDVVGRDDVLNDSKRPLSSVRFQGGIDTVGGATLASVLRSVDVNGCVAACGLVGGIELPVTVYPFILRGVRLAGITSSLCPMNHRIDIWDKLSNEWSIDDMESITTEITLAELPGQIEKILSGMIQGRILVAVS